MVSRNRLIYPAIIFFFTYSGFNSYSFANDNDSSSFSRGVIVKISGEDYRLAGAPDTENGITDIPGHEWGCKKK